MASGVKGTRTNESERQEVKRHCKKKEGDGISAALKKKERNREKNHNKTGVVDARNLPEVRKKKNQWGMRGALQDMFPGRSEKKVLVFRHFHTIIKHRKEGKARGKKTWAIEIPEKFLTTLEGKKRRPTEHPATGEPARPGRPQRGIQSKVRARRFPWKTTRDSP